MKKYINLVGQNTAIINQATITEEELANNGFKLFKYNYTVDSTLIQFVGEVTTKHIWVMFRKGSQIWLLDSGKTTNECVGDKRNYLNACFAHAYGKHITSQMIQGCACDGSTGSVKCYNYLMNQF